MYDTVRATRSGLHLALAYTIPSTLWLLGQSWLTVGGQGIPAAPAYTLLTCLLVLQAGALVLCTPWLLRYPTPRQQLCGLTMLLLTPLPLHSTAWAAGAVEARSLLLAWSFLAGLALCLYYYYRLLLSLVPVGERRALAVLCSQLLLLLLGWIYRGDGLGLLGL